MTKWHPVTHMIACAALKPASGGARYSRAAGRREVAPKGSWDRLVDETWAHWHGACEQALHTFRAAVDPTAGALLAPGETAEDMEAFR